MFLKLYPCLVLCKYRFETKVGEREPRGTRTSVHTVWETHLT